MEIDEEFKKELKKLLKKFNAEITLEDFGTGYGIDYKIVIDFNWSPDHPTPQLIIGSYEDGGDVAICTACSGSAYYCGRPCGACNGTGYD